ncbi:MAG: DUF4386 family protein [Candidatus Eremiobacteraeota bacterium]|nr:DUF4386 family protein [Candidatus Eremiobacteraeota bacterium]
MAFFVLVRTAAYRYVLANRAYDRDIAATLHRWTQIMSGLSIAAALIAILLAVSLYITLKPINAKLAGAALACSLAHFIIGALMSIVAFILFQPSNTIEINQFQSLLGPASEVWRIARVVGTACYAAASIIFFYLLFTARYIPRILSVFGMLTSLLGLLIGLLRILLPHVAIPAYGWVPIGIVELAVGLWLLIVGIRIPTRAGGGNVELEASA